MRVSPKSTEVLAAQINSREDLYSTRWLIDAYNRSLITHARGDHPNYVCCVHGVRGLRSVRPGDWIVQGRLGELVVYSDDLFSQLFSRLVEETE